MSPEDREKLVRQAAQSTRRMRPMWLDTNDMTQTAVLASLEAERGGKVEHVTDPLHLSNKVRQRARGSMIDEIRRSFREMPDIAMSYDDTNAAPLAHGVSPDDPERMQQMRQAVERLSNCGSPQLLLCVELMAGGVDPEDIAIHLNVSPSRVSQLRKEAREILRPCIDLW